VPLDLAAGHVLATGISHVAGPESLGDPDTVGFITQGYVVFAAGLLVGNIKFNVRG
jgi:hypothetical protein